MKYGKSEPALKGLNGRGIRWASITCIMTYGLKNLIGQGVSHDFYKDVLKNLIGYYCERHYPTSIYEAIRWILTDVETVLGYLVAACE